MRRLLMLAALAALLASPAAAQSPVVTNPFGVTTAETTGTITAGGTFQTLYAANSGRRGCLVQNTASEVLYVFVGGGAASTNSSFQIQPGGTFSCALTNGQVVTDAIQITTPTTGSRYVASVQ